MILENNTIPYNLLYFIELDNDNFIQYSKFITLISDEKQNRISKFKFDIDKKLSLLSDIMVRYLASKSLNLNNKELNFSKNDFGKPYLIGFPNFNYNLSHTKKAILIGISEKPLGVDIEKIKTCELKIAKRFFCQNELNYILSKPESSNRSFYEIWTQKEAYIKWVGKGMSIPLTDFDVTDTEIEKKMNTFEINNYIISVCGETNYCKDNIIKLNENQVIKVISDFIK